jgi:hypothetical protein
METTPAHHDQVTVEIAYVVVSSVVLMSAVIGVEWAFWWAFSLSGPGWQSVGTVIASLALAVLAVRGIRLLERLRRPPVGHPTAATASTSTS